MNKYQKGKIYQIISNVTGDVYYGSTCEPTLARRLAGHRACYNSYKKGKNNYVTSFKVIETGDYQLCNVFSHLLPLSPAACSLHDVDAILSPSGLFTLSAESLLFKACCLHRSTSFSLPLSPSLFLSRPLALSPFPSLFLSSRVPLFFFLSLFLSLLAKLICIFLI